MSFIKIFRASSEVPSEDYKPKSKEILSQYSIITLNFSIINTKSFQKMYISKVWFDTLDISSIYFFLLLILLTNRQSRHNRKRNTLDEEKLINKVPSLPREGEPVKANKILP